MENPFKRLICHDDDVPTLEIMSQLPACYHECENEFFHMRVSCFRVFECVTYVIDWSLSLYVVSDQNSRESSIASGKVHAKRFPRHGSSENRRRS